MTKYNHNVFRDQLMDHSKFNLPKNSYTQECLNLSQGVECYVFVKIWANTTKDTPERGVTVQRRGNVLSSLQGCISIDSNETVSPLYFSKSPEFFTPPDDKEVVPPGTTYSFFPNKDELELLNRALKEVPTIVVRLRVPLMLESIYITNLKERDHNGSILQDGDSIDAFSIQVPKSTSFGLEDIAALSANSDLHIPYKFPKLTTDKFKKILELNTLSNYRGRKASNSRGTSYVNRTPRPGYNGKFNEGNGHPNYSMVGNQANIEI